LVREGEQTIFNGEKSMVKKIEFEMRRSLYLIVIIALTSCSVINPTKKQSNGSIKKSIELTKGNRDQELEIVEIEPDPVVDELMEKDPLKKFIIDRRFIFCGEVYEFTERKQAKFLEIYEREKRAAYRWLRESGKLFPIYDKVIANNNLHTDIKFISVAESHLQTYATSGQKAEGLWQFMPSVAREYKLKNNSYMDQRRDIELVTAAACKLLKNNYRTIKKGVGFSSWMLATAAYNAGAGRIRGDIKKNSAKRIEDIVFSTEETEDYLFRIFATKFIYENEEAIFGEVIEKDLPLYHNIRKDILELNYTTDIREYILANNSTTTQFLDNNPWIKVSKQKRKRYSSLLKIVLPKGRYELLFADNSFDKSKVEKLKSKFLKRSNYKMPKEIRNNNNIVYHKVRKGENINSIAKKFGVSKLAIKKANKLNKRYTIYAGQKLKIPVKDSGNGVGFNSNLSSYTVKRGDSLGKIAKQFGVNLSTIYRLNSLNKNSVIQPGLVIKLSNSATKSKTSKKVVNYTIKRGDNLSDIAERFGISLSTIYKLNSLTKRSVIYPGDTIKLSGKSTQRVKEKRSIMSYKVRGGDNLIKISSRFGNSVDEIRGLNRIKKGGYLIKGTTIKLYDYFKKHLIQRGESLDSIAKKYGCKISDIKRWNNLRSNTIYVGKLLRIMDKS
jgi:membrane-bound lytic murein transglycosylase D